MFKHFSQPCLATKLFMRGHQLKNDLKRLSHFYFEKCFLWNLKNGAAYYYGGFFILGIH